MRKAAVRMALAKAISSGVATHATSAAGEMMRVRREPAVIAARRVQSAKRRTVLWSIGAAVPAAGALSVFLGDGAAAFGSALILRTMIYLALLAVCVSGLVRAAVELRKRTNVRRALPPPAPARTMVAARIRPEISQLGEYSDGLRKLAALAGVDPASAFAQELRQDILSSADSAERALRRRAAELTGIEQALAGAPPDAREGLRTVADELAGHIRTGVSDYGDLVTAVSQIVVAGRALRVGPDDELVERTERLRGLAQGMRELAAGPPVAP